MSSVSPSDSGLSNYYHKSLRDLQDEVDSEAKRNRELREQQTEALEKEYKAALLRKDKEADEAIRSVRSDANEAISKEKEKYDSSLDELKQRSRDNYENRDKSGLGNYYHKALDELTEQVQVEADRNREHQDQRANDLEAGYKREIQKRERDSNEAIRNVKESANESVTRERQLGQSELDKVKNQTYNARGQIPGSIAPEIYKKQIQDLHDGSQMRHESDMAALAQIEEDNHAKNEELVRRHNNQINDLTQHQVEEVNKLEDDVKGLNEFNRDAGKRQAETLKDLTLDSERKTRFDQQRLENSYNASTDKLQQDLRDKDAYYGRRSTETLRNKEAYFTDAIAKQNQENFQTVKGLQDQFSTQVSQVEKARKHDQEKSDETLGNLLARANQDRQEALERQAAGYSETLDRTRKDGQEQVDALQKSLQRQKTSDDTALISPSAEAQVRKSLIIDYEKKFNAEIERNKSTTDHMQKKYIDQYQRALEDYSDKETKTNQQNAMERSFDQSRFLDSVQDTEYRTDAKIREQQSDHDREDEGLFRQFSNLMERQRREYEHILENSRSDSESRLASFRQEADINSKTAHRAFNTRQNEIIREYEKKLADQKTESDFKLEDVKAQAQTDLRDTERRAKQDLELQAKGYDQRIAQLEAQNKERERYIAQTYQDELDRTKRSYELISKKKS